jgi:hypothetical protein
MTRGMPAGAIKYPHRATQVDRYKLESFLGARGMVVQPRASSRRPRRLSK